MISWRRCSNCGRVYTPEEMGKLPVHEQRRRLSGNRIQIIHICECGKAFHFDKWVKKEKADIFWVVTMATDRGHTKFVTDQQGIRAIDGDYDRPETLYWYETKVFHGQVPDDSEIDESQVIIRYLYHDYYKSQDEAEEAHSRIVEYCTSEEGQKELLEKEKALDDPLQ